MTFTEILQAVLICLVVANAAIGTIKLFQRQWSEGNAHLLYAILMSVWVIISGQK